MTENNINAGAGWLGDPNAARPPSEEPQKPVDHSASMKQEKTQGIPGVDQSSSLGAPHQEAEDSDHVASEDSRLLKAQQVSMTLGDEEIEDLLGDQLDQPVSFKWMASPGILAILGLASAVMLLIIGSQAASLLSDISQLDQPFNWIGYGGLAVVGLVILVCMGRLTFLYVKLRRTPLVSMKALEALSERALLREQANQHLSLAKDQLRSIVEAYPLEDRKGERMLRRSGLRDPEIEQLKEARARLLTGDRSGSYEGWLREADEQFFKTIDTAAARRIHTYGWRVGLKTAALPSGVADAAVVTINAYLLIGDLCQLYQVRAGKWGTTAVMMRVVFNVFAASRMEELMDGVADTLFDGLSQEGIGVATNLVGSLGKGIGKRVGEGGVNYVLFRRLGAATVYHLRPMRLK